MGGERWQPQAGRKGQPSAITAAKARAGRSSWGEGEGQLCSPQVKQGFITTCFGRNLLWPWACRRRNLVLQRGKQAEREGGEELPEPQSRSELGLEICSRPPLLSSGHSSLRTLNLCISWAFPPIPSRQLHRAQTTTACHPASPGLHEPSAQSPSQPSATQFSKHHHACTAQTGWLHLVPSPSTKLGETVPFFSPRLRATPLPRSPAPRRHNPGLAAPHAGRMPVGYWWDGWATWQTDVYTTGG